MAPIPATIQVSWQSNYNGPHRVCWRLVGAPSYTCTSSGSHPNCGIGPCAYNIPIVVDNETCDVIQYEGYVQAACEDESSLLGRIPFNVNFIPSPACERFEVICDSSVVGSLTINNAGSGYNPLSPPNVVIGGGGGAGATATAVVGDGAITNLPISVAGAGYVDGFYPATSLIGGSGVGATADITIAGGVVTVANLVNPGSGYLNAEVLAPDTGVVGVPGVPAQFIITTDHGTIIQLVLVLAGSGYTSAPGVVIDPPGVGTTALATAVLAGCDRFDIQDCTGVSLIAVPAGTLMPAQSTFVCGGSAPSLPDGYSVVPNGNCLCNCEQVTISPSVGTSLVRYIACDGIAVEVTMIVAVTAPLIVCVVSGSVTQNAVTPGGLASVVSGGVCP